MLIHLIRHTTPDIKSGVCYGQKDLHLANSFEQEKAVILQQLEHSYDTVFSSPLQRCQQLANALPTDNLKLEKSLMEVNFGDWEGKHWDNIPRSESQAWADDFINIAPPNGESLLQMQQRVQGFIDQNLQPQNDKRVAIVTHAGVIRLFLAWALSIPLVNIFQIKLAYGAVIEMDYQSEEHGASLRFL